MNILVATDEAVAGLSAPTQLSSESNKKWHGHLIVLDHIDFDSVVTAWAYRKFVAKKKSCEVVLLGEGEVLNDEDAEGYTVFYSDCGGGECDHHGKGLENVSSLSLMCKKYGLSNEPGLQVLIELSVQVDNAKKIAWDSIAYIVGLQNHPNFKHPETGKLDLGLLLDFLYIVFDNNYAQALSRYKTRRDYAKALADGSVTVERLGNGVRVAFIDQQVRFRGEAFEQGNDVVVWTVPVEFKNPEAGFHVGIAIHRDSNVDLAPVVAALRRTEMNGYRNVKKNFLDLSIVGTHPDIPGWYMHDPVDGCHRLVLCGSNKHPLPKDERTKIGKLHILGITKLALLGKR